MIALVYLGHAALSLVLVLVRGAPRDTRSDWIQGAAGVGVLLAAVLFFLGDGVRWRTTETSRPTAMLTAIAIGCAWLLVVVIERAFREGRWDVGCLVGVTSSGLSLFATNRWIVPALLFWTVSMVGLAALASAHPHGGMARTSVLIATALFVAGAIGQVDRAGAWQAPAPLEGWPLWATIAAAVVLSGALPGLGGWSMVGGAAAPGIPLVIGGAFLLLRGPAAVEEPLVGLGLILLALVCAGWAIARASLAGRPIMSWAVALMLGLGFVWSAGYVVSRAGIAAIAAAAIVALWPLTSGRIQIERGLLASFASITAGFNAIAAASAAAFDRATGSEAVLRAAPWVAISALLPVGLAAGIALGARVGRRIESEEYSPTAVLAAWGIFVVAVLLGAAPFGAGGRASGPVLYLVAVAAGVASARMASLRGFVPRLSAAAREPLDMERIALTPGWARATDVGAVALVALTSVATLALTFQGLRVGFL